MGMPVDSAVGDGLRSAQGARVRPRVSRPNPSESMLVYDIETTKDGGHIFHPPYLLLPDGSIAVLTAASHEGQL